MWKSLCGERAFLSFTKNDCRRPEKDEDTLEKDEDTLEKDEDTLKIRHRDSGAREIALSRVAGAIFGAVVFHRPQEQKAGVRSFNEALLKTTTVCLAHEPPVQRTASISSMSCWSNSLTSWLTSMPLALARAAR